MGELILLSDRRAARHVQRVRERLEPAAPPPITFWFDLSCPFSYLAAERVERRFPLVRWRPAFTSGLAARARARHDGRRHDAMAASRARALHMPLVWPDGTPADWRGAARAALYAGENERAAPFVLAAGRLAFCGGFDLDDPEVLAEAASAAGLPEDELLAAAADVSRDEVIATATSCLDAAGAHRLPALQLGARILSGEREITAALSAVASGAPSPLTYTG